MLRKRLYCFLVIFHAEQKAQFLAMPRLTRLKFIRECQAASYRYWFLNTLACPILVASPLLVVPRLSGLKFLRSCLTVEAVSIKCLLVRLKPSNNLSGESLDCRHGNETSWGGK